MEKGRRSYAAFTAPDLVITAANDPITAALGETIGLGTELFPIPNSF